jgi:hypothetical protein
MSKKVYAKRSPAKTTVNKRVVNKKYVNKINKHISQSKKALKTAPKSEKKAIIRKIMSLKIIKGGKKFVKGYAKKQNEKI